MRMTLHPFGQVPEPELSKAVHRRLKIIVRHKAILKKDTLYLYNSPIPGDRIAAGAPEPVEQGSTIR